jgi:uncharacterized membrane protein YphA (DoxX/SURF4 family)
MLAIFYPILLLPLALLLGYLWRKRNGVDFILGPKDLGATDRNLILFFGWVPVILGIHLAIPLLINGVQGHLFSSNNFVEGPFAYWVELAEMLIALALFYGGLTRLAALLIVILWISGIFLIGIKPMLETIQFLGFASFFYLAGRGPYAIDRILFPNLEPRPSYADLALLLLRIGIGVNLVILGYTQKLAFIPFTEIPNEYYFLITGTLEILAGLLIILGIFIRTVAILTLLWINASLTISNWNLLIDCLPIYAALAVLIVWEPNNSNQKLLWVEGLRRNMPEKQRRIEY